MNFQRKRSGGSTGDALGMIRREAAELSLERAGSSRRAAAVLVEAGYTTTAALAEAPWSAEDGGSRYESVEWRVSVRSNCPPSTLAEIRSFREQLVSAAGRSPERPVADEPPKAPDAERAAG